MTRSASRSVGLGVVAVVLCSLCAGTQGRAQSSTSPATIDAQQSAPATEQGTPMPAPNPAGGQDNPLHTASRTELDIVKVVVAQERTWNAGDIAGYISSFKDSPDTLLIGREITKGYQQILLDYQRNYTTRASMGNLAYSEIEVTQLSDTFAICVGKYHLDRTKKEGGPADGLFSLVLEKTAQGWKIVLDHTT